ncbi:MAG: DUF2891 domain-containing protein, partial [Gemmatirosa sp.]|nr:DUF2891 domain-containing protein [Gemmatirosa sp.]
MPNTLTPAHAAALAAIALRHVAREYPNKLDHVLRDADDVRGPRELHPVFYGSFDWHSCVHAHWLLARLYRVMPDIADAPRIRSHLESHLRPTLVKQELAYLEQPLRGTFERPYGWAWLLMLAAELTRHATPEGRRWAAALEPLATAFAQRFVDWLPRATYPIRAGTHFNTAFAVALGLEYAVAVRHEPLWHALRERALAWYANDVDCQAWEPGGDDFLSPALVEAECMRRVLDPAEFQTWIARFLPRLGEGQPATLFEPAVVSDRTDGKITHLDGLNLSRAWCWRALARTWLNDDPRCVRARDAIDAHLFASLPHVSGDYMGEHW